MYNKSGTQLAGTQRGIQSANRPATGDAQPASQTFSWSTGQSAKGQGTLLGRHPTCGDCWAAQKTNLGRNMHAQHALAYACSSTAQADTCLGNNAQADACSIIHTPAIMHLSIDAWYYNAFFILLLGN